MGQKTAIEWTDRTWNPIVGCSVLSPGCTNCYAMAMAARIDKMTLQSHYEGLTRKVNGRQVWTGKLARAGDYAFCAPLRRRKPTTYFVNSMGDLFHEDCPDEWIDQVFAVMALCPQHTFQVLTKRAKRMRSYLAKAFDRRETLGDLMGELGGFEREGWYAPECDGKRGWASMYLPLPNVWLGVSAERQQEADERIPLLLQTPAAVRFISAEPLLGPIDLHEVIPNPIIYSLVHGMSRLLDWVIVGGESGPHARPMHPDWARSLRDQCAATGVAFFFKQWGEYLPVGQTLPGFGKVHGATTVKPGRMKLHYGGTPERAPDHAFAERGVPFASTADGRLTFCVGKKAAGRMLDGVEHNAMPVRAR